MAWFNKKRAFLAASVLGLFFFVAQRTALQSHLKKTSYERRDQTDSLSIHGSQDIDEQPIALYDALVKSVEDTRVQTANHSKGEAVTVPDVGVVPGVEVVPDVFTGVGEKALAAPEDTKRYLAVGDLPAVNVINANCADMFQGDVNATGRAMNYQIFHGGRTIDDASLVKRAANCSTFQRMRQYPMYPMSPEEEAFPIAYAMMMYKHAEMAERLLRSVYRPQNIYCIHVDIKSDPDVKNAMKAVADCFDNVFLLTPSISVKWGKFSALHPYVLCADELLKRNKKWKYYINLTGQEFPLKTNWDLVRILSVYNGSNDIAGLLFSEQRASINKRVLYKHPGKKSNRILNPPVPHNVTLTRGGAHIVASRAFMDFTVNSQVGKDFLTWCNATGIPDEHFFNSLQHSPHLGVPGAFRGHPTKDDSINRFKYWAWRHYPCSGIWVHGICIFGVGDLKNMFSSEKLFVNKFHYDYQPLTYDCLEELHFNKTREDILGTRQLELAPYKIAYFVQDRVRMFNGEPPLPYTPITKPRKKKPGKPIKKIRKTKAKDKKPKTIRPPPELHEQKGSTDTVSSTTTEVAPVQVVAQNRRVDAEKLGKFLKGIKKDKTQRQ